MNVSEKIYFKSLHKPKFHTIGLLRKKLAMMLVIHAGGQGCQSIHDINSQYIKVTHEKCYIPLYSTLKQTRPGHNLKPLQQLPPTNHQQTTTRSPPDHQPTTI